MTFFNLSDWQNSICLMTHHVDEIVGNLINFWWNMNTNIVTSILFSPQWLRKETLYLPLDFFNILKPVKFLSFY